MLYWAIWGKVNHFGLKTKWLIICTGEDEPTGRLQV